MEWLAENYRQFGTNLEFVTDRSQEGMQFCKGFGGIGGILRYKVAFEDLAVFEDDEDEVSVSSFLRMQPLRSRLSTIIDIEISFSLLLPSQSPQFMSDSDSD